MGELEKPNEQWWAQKGRDWYDECQRRRRTVPYYMIHEVFLGGYFSMVGPCKVLEFGCGFGRHLSYLRRIPALDLYGCDQSPTMLAQAENLIEKSWLDQHTLLIPPRGSLPYADKSFDVVYTASVLIHVRPEDVTALLGELLRVCRWHILHIENIPTDQAVMTSQEHSGCWAHPLESLYGELGAAIQTLPEYGSLQGAYRVLLNKDRPAPDITCFAGRLLETETNFLAAQQRVQQSLIESQTTAIRLLEKSDERNQQLVEQQRQLTDQLAESTAAIDRQRAQSEQALSAEQQSHRKHEAESEDHRVAIADLQAQAANAREALSTAQQSLQLGETELENQRTIIADLQSRLATATEESSAAQQSLQKRKTELEDYQATITDLQAQLTTARESLSASQQSLQKRETELEDQRATIADLQSELAKTRDAFSAAQQSLQKREAELQDHRVSIADLQAQLAKAREALTAAQQTQTRRREAESAFLQQLQQALRA